MKRQPARKSDWISRVAWIAATGCGAGYVPRVPGTAGSAVGLFVALLLAHMPRVLWITTVAVLLLGFWSAGRAERRAGRKDAPRIVIDEIAGMLICLAGIPLTPVSVILSFGVFRLMDMLKPFPARRLERLAGSRGIMLDDIVAAVYTRIILLLCLSLPFVAG